MHLNSGFFSAICLVLIPYKLTYSIIYTQPDKYINSENQIYIDQNVHYKH